MQSSPVTRASSSHRGPPPESHALKLQTNCTNMEHRKSTLASNWNDEQIEELYVAVASNGDDGYVAVADTEG